MQRVAIVVVFVFVVVVVAVVVVGGGGGVVVVVPDAQGHGEKNDTEKARCERARVTNRAVFGCHRRAPT